MLSRPTIILLIGFVFLGIGTFLGLMYTPTDVTPAVVPEEVAATVATTPFAALDLEARAVVVWDVEKEKPLYVKNAYEVLPLASLTKVMTALVALESAPADREVTITHEDLQGEGDQGLRPGERWRIADLIDFTLITSSNDGALSLAALGALEPVSGERGGSFVHAMNTKADALGLEDMLFLNPTGLDTTAYMSGGYGSAHDMARLFTYAITEAPEIFESTAKQEAIFFSDDMIPHYASNTNTIADRIPWLIASKTGYTDLAGGNLAVAFDAGMARPIVVVVLGSSPEGRFRDVEQLVDITFAHMHDG
jgi:D-alanyl-D-alanine carboxypeptidase (penicillin-binding protein 5/6)